MGQTTKHSDKLRPPKMKAFGGLREPMLTWLLHVPIGGSLLLVAVRLELLLAAVRLELLLVAVRLELLLLLSCASPGAAASPETAAWWFAGRWLLLELVSSPAAASRSSLCSTSLLLAALERGGKGEEARAREGRLPPAVRENAIEVDETKVKAISNLPTLKSVKRFGASMAIYCLDKVNFTEYVPWVCDECKENEITRTMNSDVVPPVTGLVEHSHTAQHVDDPIWRIPKEMLLMGHFQAPTSSRLLVPNRNQTPHNVLAARDALNDRAPLRECTHSR
ncbi:hypothetical protein MTR67_035166, partial [Solanum verrucosum]